jgi:hypothetical protein
MKRKSDVHLSENATHAPETLQRQAHATLLQSPVEDKAYEAKLAMIDSDHGY